ncbi:hypothetical protein Tsubulata_011857 [Turnera subulata]|uniref:Histidine-containing phosphotransfer protein n=1 Tax=Turnera subulata TaxID=218843 RepID=A0A9Q0GAY9_9ROSI|nr:hypothetical protein Tsubulata_011857 [Turnera subulata]
MLLCLFSIRPNSNTHKTFTHCNMALPALKAQLNSFVQSLLDEGVLDSQFAQVQALQDESNPNFVAEVIISFCNDAEKIITDLNKNLSHQNVDFPKLDSCVHQLKGSSSSIGAQRLKLACVELHQASDGKNKAGWRREYHPSKPIKNDKIMMNILWVDYKDAERKFN